MEQDRNSGMKEINFPEHPLTNILQKLSRDLRTFIELSLEESDTSWEKWAASVIKDLEVRCWEKKNCNKKDCPAYKNAFGRCWLIAGTMCGGEVQGKFAIKYKSCTECEVYREAVFKDPVSETYEHLIALIHNLRTKEQELKAMATKDFLTGLYNRNYFEMIISREIEKIKRHGGKFSIVMIDINNFKQINDNYGHLHGDGVLKECAKILSSSVRSSDILVRFGGDEFIIVMPETDCSEKKPLLGRINNHIDEWNKKYSSSDYYLSLSIGCAVFDRGENLEDIIKKADSEMYENKLQHKNNSWTVS